MNDSTNLAHRTSLPLDVRDSLLDCPRNTWSHHAQLGGKAAFFLRYHESLRHQAAQLETGLEKILNRHGSHITGTELASLTAIGKNLVRSADHHHKMEDAYYFPVFASAHPSLRAGIELLDNDHRVLGDRLHELDRAVRIDSRSKVEYGQVALVHERASDVAQLLRRHLFDEEEVIIPIFLQAA